jgi:15-cis-phytoene synthase
MTNHTPLCQDLARGEVRAQLLQVSAQLQRVGMPAIPLEGQLLRPLLAYSSFQQFSAAPSARFWRGVAAVQLAHEASLVHDDIIDNASLRRGQAALHARSGVPYALAHGDHLLTAAYRAAAASQNRAVITMFARAVERTVAGELMQASQLGKSVDSAEYFRTVSLKSGELIGYAMAIAPALARSGKASAFVRLGSTVGVLYQMLDDLLDYCPHASSGKPTLGDYRQGRWTWPLLFMPDLQFGTDPSDVARRFFTPDNGESPAQLCLRHLTASARAIEHTAEVLMPDTRLLRSVIAEWLDRAHAEVLAHAAAPVTIATPPASNSLSARLPRLHETAGYFARNSRSFSFAARLFSAEERKLISLVYAFCRFTDDLVDGAAAADAAQTRALLDMWRGEAFASYGGTPSGMPVLDALMLETRRRDVPFTYAEQLINGVAMDLTTRTYPDMASLETYTYRVASVVGQWITELFGVHDARVLDHAAALGHAMQITNILRDVGEDYANGRVYLPQDMLARYGVNLEALVQSGEITPQYRALVDELMAHADASYARALEAVGALPRSLRMAVTAAAAIYQGIHREIRRNGYDNLTARAQTSAGRKAWLAFRALTKRVA